MKQVFKTMMGMMLTAALLCTATACGEQDAKDDQKTAETTTVATTTATTVTDDTTTDDTTEQTGANSETSIVGTWKGVYSYSDSINMAFDEPKIPDIACDVVIVFNDDGTYAVDFDETTFRSAIEENLDLIVAASMELMGEEMTIDEYWAMMEMSREEYVDMLAGNMDSSGTYVDNGGTLMIDEWYEVTYTVEGDTLTTDMIGMEMTFERL